MSEEWRDVQGWSYRVSNLGRVMRLGDSRGAKPDRILKPFESDNGRLVVCLSRNNKKRQYFVHSLVGAAFIGIRPQGKEINHKDGNHQNNSVSNLEYVTRAENVSHAVKNGLFASGEKIKNSRLTKNLAKEIRDSREGAAALARKYGVGRGTIWAVQSGRTWRNDPKSIPAPDLEGRKEDK